MEKKLIYRERTPNFNVLIDGVLYATVIEAANHLGIDRRKLYPLLNDPDNNTFQKVPPTLTVIRPIPDNTGRKMTMEQRVHRSQIAARIAHKRSHKVVADGVTYPNAKRAADALNVNERTVARRARSPNFPDTYYLKQA